MSVPETARAAPLRRIAARGTLINAAFLIGVTTLALLKGFIVAGFLSARDYGVWGLLLAALGTLGMLKQVGVPDRYIQQREPDQEQAFQEAFSLEVALNALVVVAMLVTVPVLALGFGRTELLAPGFAMVLVVPAVALQSPLWIFARRMEFGRQRRLGAIDPIVEFVATVSLAAAGLGYWSLIVGALLGNWAGALAIVRASPYRLAWRLRREAVRRYAGFSWPLFLYSLSGMIFAVGAVLVGTASLGLAGVGAIALASSIVSYTTQVDQIVGEALYPVICAVRDRSDLLLESFSKANRLGLMWGVPLGVGIALFTPDLVRYVLGAHWRGAVGIIQIFGLIAAWDQIAYNWDDYFRARGETRPIAVVALAATGVYVAVALPLLATNGLTGFGVGMALSAVVGVAGRLVYITRLFPAFAVAGHVIRALAPTAPAAAAVALLRLALRGSGLAGAVLELVVYVLGVGVATGLVDRPLLRELAGYLTREPAPVPEAP